MFVYTEPQLRMPVVQEQADGNTWLVMQPYCYVRPDGQRIYVPPAALGTTEEQILSWPTWTTDMGSIPRIFQNIFPRDGILAPIYVVHDWLYASELFSRDMCDEILFEGARELGYDAVERDLIYQAVRIGGDGVWVKHNPVTVKLLQNYYNTFLKELPQRWPQLLPGENGRPDGRTGT